MRRVIEFASPFQLRCKELKRKKCRAEVKQNFIMFFYSHLFIRNREF